MLAEDYAGGPVLLEELRWKVLIRQYGPTFVEMTDAKQKSFARTIHDHFPEYAIQKTPIDHDTPVGLVARTVVYRLKTLNQLHQFMHGEEPCILCRYRTNMEVDEPRYRTWKRYVTAHYYVATFRFFAQCPTGLSYENIERVPGTLIPATHRLSLIVGSGVDLDVRSVAAVPWRLFGYERLNDWYEVDALDSLGAVERNHR